MCFSGLRKYSESSEPKVFLLSAQVTSKAFKNGGNVSLSGGKNLGCPCSTSSANRPISILLLPPRKHDESAILRPPRYLRPAKHPQNLT